MQFVANGPDIPNELLQAHEEGRLVFFCGTGISYPARLPDFENLVCRIYQNLGIEPDKYEHEAYIIKQFDITLNLLERRLSKERHIVRTELERRLSEGRHIVRTELAKILEPDYSQEDATDTHEALLELSKDKDDSLRLVTTNCDHIFEDVIKENGISTNTYAAPLLPPAKNNRWDGIVYLHGLLKDRKDSTLNSLVFTSSDFGKAYLTERWAARFVSELFRNYVVCFVGYSINDTILRYMMDALAADGDPKSRAYAFGGCMPDKKDQERINWEVKGVIPVLYEISDEGNHSALHRTLKKWAKDYRDGSLGKERIVIECAGMSPSKSTTQDDFVGRVLWALSDESGLLAKYFADSNPVPYLEWLETFIKSDVSWMKRNSSDSTNNQWKIKCHIDRWLLRHLNDPRLFIWVTQNIWYLDENFKSKINNKLDELAELEKRGDAEALSQISNIRANAPNAVPDKFMRTLWRLFLAGRVKSNSSYGDIHNWLRRLKRDGLTTALRFELRDLLMPKIVIKEPLHWDIDKKSVAAAKQPIYWELDLSADSIRSTLSEEKDESLRSALPTLLQDFQRLLCDMLELYYLLHEGNKRCEISLLFHLPSISPHWQNRGFYDWTMLIKLLRDAWLATREKDHALATRIAQDWFDLPYSTFKRLALFAASQDDCIPSAQWVNWLTIDKGRWLWSVETNRECLRLLVLQGAILLPKDLTRLENAILTGPQNEDSAHAEQTIWLRLAKLRESGLKF